VSGRLNIGPQPVISPAARLDSPGLAIVYLTAAGSHLAFTGPARPAHSRRHVPEQRSCSKARKWSKHDPRVRACPLAWPAAGATGGQLSMRSAPRR
jgi:hypothetical protein